MSPLYIFAGLAVLAYLGGPLLIFAVTKLQGELVTTRFYLEKLRPEVQAHLLKSVVQLKELDFVIEACLMLPASAPNLRTHLILMSKRATGEKAMITAIVATDSGANPVPSCYTEFSSRFASGKLVDTSNSTTIGSFDPFPHETKTSFAGEQDLALLHQLHGYIIREVAKIAPDDAPQMYPEGGAETYMGEIWKKGFEEQIEVGVMRHVGEVYRPTLKGAFKMTWRLLFPRAQQLAAQRDRRAAEILRNFHGGWK